KEQGASLSPAIGQPATGVGIDCAEQGLQRIEQADNENASAEKLKILRRELKPESFAGAGQEQGHQQENRVSAERQETGHTAPTAGSGAGLRRDFSSVDRCEFRRPAHYAAERLNRNR